MISKQQFEDAFNAGVTRKALAKEHGVSVLTVDYWLHQYYIPNFKTVEKNRLSKDELSVLWNQVIDGFRIIDLMYTSNIPLIRLQASGLGRKEFVPDDVILSIFKETGNVYEVASRVYLPSGKVKVILKKHGVIFK